MPTEERAEESSAEAATAKSVNAVLIVGGVAFKKRAHIASHSARTPPPECVTRCHRLALQYGLTKARMAFLEEKGL